MENPAHFQSLLDNETQRLKALCKKWQKFFDTSSNITDELSGQILLAVGQTNLLIKEKFKQFRNLIKECELGSGKKTVTLEDLHGFWDLVCIQIEDVDHKFDFLEKLSNPYVDEYLNEPIPAQSRKILAEMQENDVNGERLVANKELNNSISKENALSSVTSDPKNKYFKV